MLREVRCRLAHHKSYTRDLNSTNLSPEKQNIRPSSVLVYLFQASLDAAVLAGDGFGVPVVCGAAGHAQIWVTFPHSQVAWTLFGVALCLTPAAWEAILAWKTSGHIAAVKGDMLKRFMSKLHAAIQKDNTL